MAGISTNVCYFITSQVFSKTNRTMWTEEAIKKTAENYFEKYYKYDDAIYKRDVIDIFTAGAKYIINQIQDE
jgi:hypothetical protein